MDQWTPDVTRLQHRDPEVARHGYVGTFVDWHPTNPCYALIRCDDGDDIMVTAADWEPAR